MGRWNLLAALALIPITTAAAARGAEVRYYEKDGVTYRETRKTVQRPITETHYETRERTVYREQYHTAIDESVRHVLTPVTEYRWVTVLKGRWNPFAQPYLAHELRPVQRWETRQHIIRTPIRHRELVPVTRTVQVPVTTHRMAEAEVITRVAVSGSPSSAPAANVAAAPPNNGVGGVARLENDPPRGGTGWRSAGEVTRY